MLSLRSRRFSMPLGVMLVLLAAAIQTIPVVVSQSGLHEETDFERSTFLVAPAGCQPLWKRAVGAIPISSGFSDAASRQEVARRAVGSVADPGNLCDPISALKSTSQLKARSNPTPELAGSPPELSHAAADGSEMHSFEKRSSIKPTTNKSAPAKKPAPIKTAPNRSAEPSAAYKFSRGRAW